MKRLRTVDRPAAKDLSISELQQQCQTSEDRLRHIDIEKVKLEFAKAYLFSPRAPVRSTPSQPRRGFRLEEALEDGRKYRSLLESVRQAKTRREKLWVLAWWLKTENVCEPEEIVDSGELQRSSKEHFGFMSAPEYRYAAMVDAWVPYFERLLKDFRATGSKSKLTEMGYDASAVTAAIGKRSPVSTVCQWLASRSAPTANASSFANAYSCIHGKKPRASMRRFLQE